MDPVTYGVFETNTSYAMHWYFLYLLQLNSIPRVDVPQLAQPFIHSQGFSQSLASDNVRSPALSFLNWGFTSSVEREEEI